MTEFQTRLRRTFPELYELPLLETIEREGHPMSLKQDEVLMEPGQYIKSIPLVMEGMLKILREDDDGHELLLYYVKPGETCAMSLTCCLGESRSNVRAVVEEDAEIIAIPVRHLDQWTQDFRSFKSFVMLTYQKRFEELLKTIDGIAFQKLDDRLLAALKEKQRVQQSTVIQATHQELAQELNSSREVISRLLKQMEKRHMVKLSRNKIELTGLV
ncbi:MAG: Crp/Fnr family transcriptional regulator [Flavobacteriales bacterium]|nr:Crp/Fnr family transcriptional regulator [Flavobacteriales bacterium]